MEITNETREELARSSAYDNDWLLALVSMRERAVGRIQEKNAKRRNRKQSFFDRWRDA